MKTLKVMSIIGIVLFSFGTLVILVADPFDAYSGIQEWGGLLGFYGIAYAIVGVVQANRLRKKHGN